MRKYTADFETTTDEKDCRVWAYAICEIGGSFQVSYGNSIEDFINVCKDKKSNDVYYFHNLKFDASYILYYLLTNGYTWIKNKKMRKDNTFTTLISNTGNFYSVEVYFEVKGKKVNKVTFYDSLKILNFSVDKIAKDFNLITDDGSELRKLKIDYHEKREIGHELTSEEKDYIKADVLIMAKALNIMFNEGLTKMTIGSDAINYYKKINTNFNSYFPILNTEVDLEIRKSYKGGWTFLSDKYKEKTVKNGIVIDKNSMYPSHMKFDILPFGEPIKFDGKYKDNRSYPLYIQYISCSFKLKKGKLPSIQLKNNPSFMPTEYLSSSNDEIVTLCLTSVDLELFFMQYEVFNIEYLGGYMFKGIKGLFTSYIEYWMNKKNEAKKEGNGALYQIAKLMLNSLYGKFGLNPITRSKEPYIKDDVLKFNILDKEERDPIYVALASFVTAYSRKDIILTSQKIRDYTLEKYKKDYYIYSDSDSIHMLKMSDEELKEIIDIDDYRLGAYKIESSFKKGVFIRQKCYIEEGNDGIIKTTIAGLPKRLGKYINFNNFKKGLRVLGDEVDEPKLRYKQVKGGVLLVKTDFSIKD